MQRTLFSCLLLVLSLTLLSLHLYQNSVEKETLVLFLSKDRPIVTGEELEEIEDLAKEMGIDFLQYDADKGLPEQVTTLPSIYFQNRKGRSKYYGRYSNMPRLKNFIRTSKLAHQKNEGYEKKQLMVWNAGRADITAPLKLTELTGNVPADFDQAAFLEMAQKALVTEMNYFKLADTHLSTKNTRSFYVNIYPYLSETNELFLTTEIFSQFNCITSVYKDERPVASAKWKDRSQAFSEAGIYIERQIARQISYSEVGDAFQAVSEKTELLSWEELGLALESSSEDNKTVEVQKDITLPRSWKVVQRTNKEEPIIIYSFLSPVDSYAGEVKELAGVMALSEHGSMKGATGKFVVDVKDVTMGATDLDEQIHKKMLKISSFPEASFEFSAVVKGGEETLKVGESQALKMEGVFTMMGIQTPIVVDTEIEPIIGTDGEPKLLANCTFQLPLFEKFNVVGPDGPSPAKDILQFYMRFHLEAN